MTSIAPRVVPLPDPPTGDCFTEAQWTTLFSIMDTVIPSLQRESAGTELLSQSSGLLPDEEYDTMIDNLKKTLLSNPTDAQLDEYLSEKPSANPEFQELLKRSLLHFSREEARKKLAFLMSALK